MYLFTLRSLLTRRRRAALTALAVVVGVAMVSGAYVFTDTIRAALHDVLASQAKGADVVVSSRQGLYSTKDPAASMPASLISSIARLPGVASAQGQVSDVATIVGSHGHVVRQAGAPTLALSYQRPPFTGVRFVAGTAPSGQRQVALDEETAKRQHYRLGDLVPIVTGEPARRFRLVGLARLGSASIGGATVAVFDLATAQELYGKQGLVDSISVAATTGTPPERLVQEIGPLLPPGLVAQTAAQAAGTNLGQLSDQLQVLTGGSRAFGFIALLVGAFMIMGTLSVTVRQRTRELALLRAVGATRAQLLRSVVVEAVAIGAPASAVGVAAGLGAAAGIRAVLAAVGVDVPSTGVVLEPRTIALGLGVGIGVTVAAYLVASLRSTRVSPIEAMRGAEAPDRGPSSPRPAAALALVLTFVGAGVAFTASGTSSARLTGVAVGAVMLVAAAVLVTPLVVPALARAVAWPAERRGRIVARLARENAVRSPVRTAVTASSLMIGLALVLFVSVYVSGVRTATRRAIARTFAADFAIGSADGASSIPPVSARAVALVPNLLAVSSVRAATAHVAGVGDVPASGIDTTSIGQVYRFSWVGRGQPDVGSLGPGDVLLERSTARAAGLHVGDRVALTSPAGLHAALTVRGIYADRGLLSGMALPSEAFDRLFHQSRPQQVLVKVAPGSDPVAAGAQIRQTLSNLPGVVVRSEAQLADAAAAQANSILVLLYALFAVSAITALVGILGALALSIHERTRELGVLRALGMTPAQVRALIRDESLIMAAIGTAVGTGLGVALGFVVSRALTDDGIVFAIPWAQVGLLIAVGLLVGVLAALPPAGRAARIDVLTALSYE